MPVAWGLWELVGGRHKSLVGIGETQMPIGTVLTRQEVWGWTQFGLLVCAGGFALV